MNNYRNEELKRLISEFLRDRPDSYPIQQLFEQFPTTTELIDVCEEQLITIKGISSRLFPQSFRNPHSHCITNKTIRPSLPLIPSLLLRPK
jgi:hypothetical protein